MEGSDINNTDEEEEELKTKGANKYGFSKALSSFIELYSNMLQGVSASHFTASCPSITINAIKLRC